MPSTLKMPDLPVAEYDDLDEGEPGFEPGEIEPTPQAPEPPAPAEEPVEAAEAPSEPAGRMRDPATGRFLPKDAAAPEAPAQPVSQVKDRADVHSQPAPPVGEEFGADLLTLASEAGFSEDDARAFGSPERLQQAIAILDARKAQWGISQLEAQEKNQAPAEPQPPQQPQFTQQFAPQPQQFTPNVPAQPQANGHAPAQSASAAFEKFKLELNPEDGWTDDTIKVLTGLNDYYHQALVERDQRFSEKEQLLEALLQATLINHEGLQQITGQSQADAQARAERDMDSWFDQLGDEWRDEFGKGPIADLPDNSPQLTNRLKLARQMRGLAVAYENEGKSVPSLDVLRDRAFGSLYYQQIHSRARQALTAKVSQRNGQTLSRASSGGSKPKSPDEAAKEFVRRFQAERAAVDDDEDAAL